MVVDRALEINIPGGALKNSWSQDGAASSAEARDRDHASDSPFDILLENLAGIQETRRHNRSVGTDEESVNAQYARQKREVVQHFVENQVGTSPRMPWIEARLNPVRLTIPVCHTARLPDRFSPHFRDIFADTALVPYAPPVEYMENPPSNFYTPKTELQNFVYQQLYWRGIDHLHTIANDDPRYLASLRKELGEKGAKFQADCVATWAHDQAMRGVEKQRARVHSQRLEESVRSPEGNIVIPNARTLRTEFVSTAQELEDLHRDIGWYIDNPAAHPIVNYEDRTQSAFERIESVIDQCRWHLDHNTPLSDYDKSTLIDTLSSAYRVYHSILQTCNSQYLTSRDQAFHDVSVLMGGVKVDNAAQSARNNVSFSGEADYMDAFMAVATHDDVVHDYAMALLNRQTIHWDKWPEGRSYFGDFESSPETIRQQLTLMCVLFFRMPEWQQEAYKDVIQNAFTAAYEKVMSRGTNLQEEKQLYIPTVSRLEIDHTRGVPFDLHNPQDIAVAQHIAPLMELAENISDPFVQKSTAYLEIKPEEGMRIEGVRGFYWMKLDQWGFLEPVPLQQERRSHTEEAEKEWDVDGDPAYEKLLEALQALPPTPSYNEPGFRESLFGKRSVIENFVRERTGTSRRVLPWLEKRNNPPPMDYMPCKVERLPDNFVRHHTEREADRALIPHIPPLEYLQNPPPHLYDPPRDRYGNTLSPIDYQVDEIALEALREAYKDNPAYREAISKIGGWEQISRVYWTWAEDTRIDGVDQLRSAVHTPDISEAFSEGTLAPYNEREPNGSITDDELVLIDAPDAALEGQRAQEKLDTLLGDISLKVDDPAYHIANYKERRLSIWYSVKNTIDVCRWHLDHGTLDESDRATIIETLGNAYQTYNTLLQTCNDISDNYHLYSDFHDLSTLIAGMKIDQPFDGGYRQGALLNGRVDYFDAFMAVAQSSDVAARYREVTGGYAYGDDAPHNGGRPLLGTFEAGAYSLRQQKLLMSVMYSRMSDWQKEIYADIVWGQYITLDDKIERARGDYEPQVFVPSAMTATVRYPDHDAVDYQDAHDIVRYQYISPLIILTKTGDQKYLTKDTAVLEVMSGTARRIIGWQSTGAWVDAWGFVHPGNEPRKESREEAEGAAVASFEIALPPPPESWLKKIENTVRAISIESRMGRELAAKIHELVTINPENGSVKAVAGFAVMLERLLGRKPTEGENKFVGMLQEIGMINAQTGELQELSGDALEDALERMRTHTPELGDLDEGSLLLILLGCSGVAPREELAEQVIKAYSALENVLVMESAKALDEIEKKKWWRLFRKKKEKPNVVFSSRDTMAAFVKAKREINPDYDPQTDPEWQDMAKEVIAQVTKTLHGNKSYDATMKSSLYAVIAAKEKGKFVARCNVDGELLTSFLRFISPDLVTYSARTYGPEELLSLTDWYGYLETAEESGAESHGYNQTNFAVPGGMDIYTADATGGFSYGIPVNQIEILNLPEGTLRYGELTLQYSEHIYNSRHRRRALGQCVTGGSILLADLAVQANQLDYERLANPDSPLLWLREIVSEKVPLERQAAALDRLLLVEPYRLAMSINADFSAGNAALILERVVDVARRSDRWGGAFMAANILARAHYFDEDVRKGGASLRVELANILAARSENEHRRILEAEKNFITDDDIQLIHSARQKYLAELEREARERQAKQDEIEREMRQKHIAQSQANLETAAAETRIKADNQRKQDAEREKESQENSPAFGRSASAEYKQDLAERSAVITKETVTRVSPNALLASDNFEFLTADTQRALIETALRNVDGTMLTGEKLEQRIRVIQAVFMAKAYQLTDDGEKSSQEHTGTSLREEQVVELASALNDQFSAAAHALGVHVPALNPQINAGQTNFRKMLRDSS